MYKLNNVTVNVSSTLGANILVTFKLFWLISASLVASFNPFCLFLSSTPDSIFFVHLHNHVDSVSFHRSSSSCFSFGGIQVIEVFTALFFLGMVPCLEFGSSRLARIAWGIAIASFSASTPLVPTLLLPLFLLALSRLSTRPPPWQYVSALIRPLRARRTFRPPTSSHSHPSARRTTLFSMFRLGLCRIFPVFALATYR